MAIAKITIDPANKEDLKSWNDRLENLEGKKTNLYLLIDAHSGNTDKEVIYHGQNPDKDGKPDTSTKKNYWLDMDRKWFQLHKPECCKAKLDIDQLKNIASYASDTNINEHIEGLNEAFEDNSINTCIRRIHFLAQVIHESGSFQYTAEIGASETDYGGFKGRGLIQLTFKSNYKSYGEFVEEDVTSSQKNKEKLESDPHAAKSAGWYWGQKAKLNNEADENDFIYITYAINGGYNGYNDRLNWVKNGFEELYENCENENDKNTTYKFTESKAYNVKKASFGWGLWHDPDLNKSGCTKNKEKAISGYERFIALHDDSGKVTLTKKWYGYSGNSIRKTVEERLKILKNENDTKQ